MDGQSLRGLISMNTQRLYIRLKTGIYQDDFEKPWDELDKEMKEWYRKLSKVIGKT